MTIEEAIRTIEDMNAAICEEQANESLKMAIDALRAQQEAEKLGWISVKDRLPNDQELKESENWCFLCRLVVPDDGGVYFGRTEIVRFDLLLR